VSKVGLTCELLHSERKIIEFIFTRFATITNSNLLNHVTELCLNMVKNARRVIDGSDFCLRNTTHEKMEKSSMTVNKYLTLAYDSFGKGSEPLVCIISKTSVDLDSSGFGTLCLDVDRVHRLLRTVDELSGIKYAYL
jgi:hypothetical protein